MATIIDSLLVVLGLDTKGFDAGRKRTQEGFKKTREDTEKSGKTIAEFGKKSENAMKSLKSEVIGLFLAFQGASSLEGFVKNMIVGDAAAGRLAKNLGMDVTTLTAYGLAIQSVGGSADEANAALSMLASAREQLKLTGTTGHDAEFGFLGFGPDDLNDTAKAFDKLAEAAQRMPRTQFYQIAHNMGLTDGVINLLELGPKKMHALIDARKADAAATQKQADEAERLQAKWADLTAQITALVRPNIYSLVEAVLSVFDGIKKTDGMSTIFIVTLGAIAVAAAALGSPFIAAAAAVILLATSFDKLKEAWKAVSEFVPHMFDVHSEAHPDAQSGWSWDMFGVKGPDKKAAPAGGGGGAAPARGGGGGGGGDVNGAMKDAFTREYARAYLKGKGFTDEQANGIVAGIAAEGGGLNTASGPYGAYGIGQWLGKRKERLFAKYGPKPTLRQQMEFLTGELNGGDHGGASVRAGGSAADTMTRYLRDFMRPQGAKGEHMRDLIEDLKRGFRVLRMNPELAGRAASGGAGNVTIGQINLPGVRDADGFARQLPAAIRRRGMTAQANRGLD